MKRFGLIALGFFCAIASESKACSPLYETTTGEQYYSHITPSEWSNWDISQFDIGVVYVKGLKEKKRSVKVGEERQKKKKPFVKVKYQLIQKLTPGYIAPDKGWIAELRPSWALSERKTANKPRPFSFWDIADLSSPVEYNYGAGVSSCGSMPTQTVLPDNYYIHIKRENQRDYWEILNGPEDQLINDFEAILSGTRFHKARRKPEDYFRDITGYLDIALVKCPSNEDISEQQYWVNSDGKKSSHDFFEILSSYNSNPGFLDIIDLEPYLNRTKEKPWNCKVGSRFLVLDQVSKSRDRNRGFFTVNPVRHRYLPVKNDKIEISSILSHIEIVAAKPLHIDEVKSWIEKSEL